MITNIFIESINLANNFLNCEISEIMDAHMTPIAIGKNVRDMTNVYDAHLTSIPKLSPRIGFCNVSIILNVQLITKKATIRKTIH